MNELDISPGFETQVAVTPTLFATSNSAKNRFTPDERGCYMDHELSLTYLPNQVYRYGINNCLFEAAYEQGALPDMLKRFRMLCLFRYIDNCK